MSNSEFDPFLKVPQHHNRSSLTPTSYGASSVSADYTAASAAAYGPLALDRENWKGITSLVLSILGLSLFGVIFGHMGLAAAKRGAATNPGIALAGTVLGYVGMVLGFIGGILIVAALALDEDQNVDSVADGVLPSLVGEGPSEDGTFGIWEANNIEHVYLQQEVAVGDCLMSNPSVYYDLAVISCGGFHLGEVMTVVPLTEMPAGADLETPEATTHIMRECDADFEQYVGVSADESIYDYWYFFMLNEDDTTTGAYFCVVSEDWTPRPDAIQASGK